MYMVLTHHSVNHCRVVAGSEKSTGWFDARKYSSKPQKRIRWGLSPALRVKREPRYPRMESTWSTA